MPNTKPLVAVAVVCERVLTEADNVFSAIRLVDTFYLPPAPEELPANIPQGVDLTLFISLKSGDLVGAFDMHVTLRTPTGKTAEIHRGPMTLKGGEHGVNMKVRFAMPATEFGLYWFDVWFEDDVLTSIPFKLVLGLPQIPPAA